jgi:hypothetical protein
MRAGGLSSAPLDTIKFIREVLYYLDIINDEELNLIKRSDGFTGKKQAMLSVLKAKQQEINAKTQEIADRVTSTLDDFINGVGANRGREEKYAAQAAAQEMASQMRQAKSGKEMDDALTDIVSDEAVTVRTSVAMTLIDILKNANEPDFNIDTKALDEVISDSRSIRSIASLKSFVNQISSDPRKTKIAAYLSAIIKPISQGTEDEEMQEDAEDDFDLGQSEDYDPGYSELPDRELQAFADELGFTATEPGPNTYNSRMYEIEDLYVSEDGAVYLGKYNNPRFPYFVGYEYGRVSADSPSKLEEPIRRILAGEDPEDEFLTGEDPEEEEYKASKADINNDGELEDWEKGLAKKRGFKGIPNEEEESKFVDVKSGRFTVEYGSNNKVLSVQANDRNDRGAYIDPILVNKYLDEGYPLTGAIAAAMSFPNEHGDRNEDQMMMGESYTSMYLTEQTKKDSVYNPNKTKNQSFKDRYKPKTSWQLEELRRYGM